MLSRQRTGVRRRQTFRAGRLRQLLGLVSSNSVSCKDTDS